MTGEVVLSAALRSNLLSLQRTQSSIDKVQNVLATGLKVASALDNPQSFFASQALKNRSSDLTRLLDGIGQSIQTIKAADAGVSALTKLVDQADSLVEAAREAVTNGAVEAVVTGNVDLSGTSNLTSILGISNTDDIVFTYYNATSTATTATINIDTSDSIDQLIAEINDIGGGGFFEASLTSEGYLSIKETRGHSFNVNFTTDAAAAAFVASDSALANALGFGEVINASTRNGNGTAEANAEVTVLARTRLVSGAFYESGGVANGFAEASDGLLNVVDALGGAGARFGVESTGDDTNLTFRINGTQVSANIDIDNSGAAGGLTIQGLVDAINNDATVGDLIEASYDESTGQFTIEALDASVKSIGVSVAQAVAAGAGTTEADFDFGLDDTLTPGGSVGDAEGETFYLASAADTLERLQSDYNTVLTQIDELVEDSGYRGVNLLSGDDLETFFNEDRSNSLTTSGSDLTSAGLGISAADFSTLAKINTAGTEVLAAKTALRDFGSTISNSLSIIQTRENFTKSLVETLNEGSDKLTIADQNEEGAKLLALQTRQQLGVTALSLAAQAQQSVLRLF